MAQDDDKQRTKRDRIERLRKRLEAIKTSDPFLVNIIKGILDILADEL